MPILTAPSAPAAPVLTLAQKKVQVKAMMSNAMQRSFNQLVADFNKSFDMVWNNKAGLTPQDVFDAFGVEAAQLFQVAGATQSLINTLVPNTATAVPPNAYVMNQDGTVTVGAKNP